MARSLEVYLRFSQNLSGADRRHVGRLTWDATTASVVFRYESGYVRTGLEISPLLMPLSTQTYSGPARVADRDQDVFLGLPPVFSDSLPDRWGRGILDTALARQGIENASAMDYLGMLGHRAMGALVYEPSLDEIDNNTLTRARDLYSAAYQYVEGQAEHVVADLKKIGGSAGGMRPKLLIGYNPDTHELWRGLNHMPGGFVPALMKLPLDINGRDASDYMRIEYAYHLMAEAAGLQVPRAWLLEVDEASHTGAYFIVERFDWDGQKREHLHSLGALVGRNFNRLDYDYDSLLKSVMRLCRDRRQAAHAFRQAVFNIIAVNWDDHIKNFAFLMDASGEWRLSPAFDVTYSIGRDGQPSTAVTGKKQGITQEDLLKLAKRHGIDEAPAIIDQVKTAVAEFPHYAQQSGVPEWRAQKIIGLQRGGLGL